ncbi:MAG TPA: ABC transporter permease [Actinomycetales bacterium]|nr:ABC transporter permease [Actinomycetales bacterium]
MTKFILRRLGISFLILLGGSLLLYVLTINSGDPIADLRESNDENRELLIQRRTEYMGLDLPWYQRYWTWLVGVSKCVTLNCDLGLTRNGVSVNSLLVDAAGSTLRLVILATLLAIVIGIATGILTAIRQYSGFDYVVTFLAFLFFSLPVFWAAVLLKDYGAIRFNNWIADPQISTSTMIIIAVVLGLILQGIMGGDLRRRLLTAGVTAVFTFGALFYFTFVGWFLDPALGVGIIALAAAGGAVIVVTLISGLENRRVLYSALTTVAFGAVAFFAIAPLMHEPSFPLLFLLAFGFIAAGALIGKLWGGDSSGMAIATSVITSLITFALIVTDYVLRAWPGYLKMQPRPISTIGSQTPNFEGEFWQTFIDRGTQLLLPTILLTLISVASYTRYTRSSMLEVLEQDYVRTARSKGLSERTVITKHAFRNALIPITTIVAFDFASLIGGAVITEQVFGWRGMGQLFVTGLDEVDPGPVMAFFLVTGTAAVVMNMLADIMYAYLDPRIRR